METAGGAAEGGTTCSPARHPLPCGAAPAPPRRIDGKREERLDGGELRKSGPDAMPAEELRRLCSRFSSCLVNLINRDRDSQVAEVLEGLAADAGDDLDTWRSLVDLAASQLDGEEEII